MTTRWSLVLQAGLDGATDKDSKDALTELCRAYWYPLYGFVRRQGHNEEDAKDLIQSFFENILRKDAIKTVDPDKGRFRSYLLGSLKNHLVNQNRRANAIKRGGAIDCISIDTKEGERLLSNGSVETRDPEKLYHRNWAEALLNQALNRLREDHAKAGKHTLFEKLEPHLIANDASGETRAEMAKQLGMTVGAIGNSLRRLRQRYGDLVREAIADTVGDPREVDEELQFLMAVLREQA